MLSRFGPLGLSVLALAASFVIVLTGGGVLAAAGLGTSEQAPTPAPSPTRTAPAPADPNVEDVEDVEIDVDKLDGDKTLRSVGGATFYLWTAPSGGAVMSGGGDDRTLLCVTLPDDWSLRPATLSRWSAYHNGDHCRPVQPGMEVLVRLERVR